SGCNPDTVERGGPDTSGPVPSGSAGALGPDAQDVGVRLRRVGADGEGDGLTHLVLGGSAVPGTCQVALRSVRVADGEVGGQVAEERGLGIERAFLVLPGRDDLLFERHVRPPLGRGTLDGFPSSPPNSRYLPIRIFATSPGAVTIASWPVLSSWNVHLRSSRSRSANWSNMPVAGLGE